MLIKEYRIPLPITVEEYQVAQLWSVAEASKNETGGGEGIEVLENHPFENKQYGKGQYTKKIYHFASRVPKAIKMFAPKGSLDFLEEAWNAYPYCRTVITNPDYMKDNFEVSIETWHKPGLGELENVHKLEGEELRKREVVHIDIVNDPISSSDYKEEFDPKKFKGVGGREALTDDWLTKLKAQVRAAGSEAQQNGDCAAAPPNMCAYKLVRCKFKWLGMQNITEKFIHNQERRLFTNFHRQVFGWMGGWYGLTMDDIRRIEDETKAELDEMRKRGSIRGTKVGEVPK